jgi:asparagine synthase (glutamine-hydrolysing)
MLHRGPDEQGTFFDPATGVGLASTRLAIQDVEQGHQPMQNKTGGICIVFNGEIFNAPELRERLIAAGHRFATDHSDTEVLVHLYEERGPAMVDDLNGMFAFVIFDRDRNRLFGARDQLGIKPLYLTQLGGGLSFASELKVLLAVPGVERVLDRQSAFDYLSLRYVPGPGSIFVGVDRLPAASAFAFDLASRELKVWQYWRPEFDGSTMERGEELLARLREELRAAVQRWTLSDVPIACSLSGGIDSSAIVGLMREVGYDNLHTFSLGFEDENLNELELARLVAQRNDTEHHELMMRPTDLIDDLLQMVWALDEPYGGGLPSWYVFRFMSESVKVGMTGTGGDELFGSYGKFVPFEEGKLVRLTRHAHMPIVRAAARIAAAVPGGWVNDRSRAALRDLRSVQLDPVRWHYFDRAYYFGDADKRRSVVDGATYRDTAELLRTLFRESGAASVRDAVLYADTRTQLPEEFLHMTDRFSMAHSLEARVPLLDRELVEVVAGIPADVRTNASQPKALLRESISDLLPPELLRQPKRGFVIPQSAWLRGELRPVVEQLLSRDRLRRQGIFRPELVDRYVDPHLSGRSDHGDQVWNLLMFQLWHLLFVEEQLDEAPTFGVRDVVGGVHAAP